MKKEYLDVNANKLHDELIRNGIKPVIVESIENKTWVTFKKETNMELVQQLLDVHDPTPLPTPLSEIDLLKLSQAEQFELILEFIGGM